MHVNVTTFDIFTNLVTLNKRLLLILFFIHSTNGHKKDKRKKKSPCNT